MPNNVLLSVALTRELYDAVKSLAETSKQSMGEIVRVALIKYFEEVKK